MDTDLIRRWVEALRSGQYKQGQNLLKYIPNGETEPHYCCLGVLCEIADGYELSVERKAPQGLIFGVPEPLTEEQSFFGDPVAYEAMPPETLVGQVGLAARDQHDPRSKWYYATMNDEGYSFEEIADKLEATFLS